MFRSLCAFFLAFVIVSTVSVMAGEPQVVAKADQKTWDRENLAGGVGTLYGTFSVTRHETLDDDAIKEIGWLTLQPGSSVGLHKHIDNEDAYIITSGEGLFTDGDGKETIVRAGDIAIARKGQSHGLVNTGTEPLVFVCVIAQK